MSKLNGRGSTSKPAELMSLWCNLCQKCIVQLSVSWHLGWVGGEGVLTCIQTMLRTTSRFREKGVSQRGLWWNILVNGSVTQVFHNSMHKIGSGTVSAKVSCPYLEFAQTHKCIHTHKQMAMGYKEVEEIKADGRKWAFRQCNNKNNNNLMKTTLQAGVYYHHLGDKVWPPSCACLCQCMLVSVQSRCSFLVQNSLKRNLRHNFVNKPIQSWTCKRGTKLSKEGTEREELRVT